MVKNNLLNEGDIKEIINDSLYNNGLISQEIYEKCGKPKYISELPYDLRTNDVDKLNERLSEIEKRLKNNKKDIKDFESQIKKQERDKEKFQKKYDKASEIFGDWYYDKENKIGDIIYQWSNFESGNHGDITVNDVEDKLNKVKDIIYERKVNYSDADMKLFKDASKILSDYAMEYDIQNYPRLSNRFSHILDLSYEVKKLSNIPKYIKKADEDKKVANAMIIESDNNIKMLNHELDVLKSENEYYENEKKLVKDKLK